MWISEQIKKEIKIGKPTLKQPLKEFFCREGTYPTRQAILSGVLGATLINFVSYLTEKFFHLSALFCVNFITSFLPIIITFGTLLFTMLIALIELARNTGGLAKSTREVLIKETKIIPIFYFYLANIFYFSFSDFLGISIFSQFLVFKATIIAIGYAYYKFSQLQFFPLLLKRKSIDLFKEKIAFSMKNTLNERLGKSLFYKFLKDNKISYEPWSFHDKKKYLPLKLSLSGKIEDIELNELKKFINELVKEQDYIQTEKDIQIHEIKEEKSPLILTRLLGDKLPEDNSLIFVEKSLIKNERDKMVLEKRIQKIFKIVDDKKEDELNEELVYLKGETIKNIIGKRKDIVSECLNIWKEGVKIFVEKLNEFDIHYDRDLAEKELSSIEGGWKEMDTLLKNFKAIIDESFIFFHPEILKEIIDFPWFVAADALKMDNYYIFSLSLNITSYIYRHIITLNDEKLQNSLVRNLSSDWKNL